MNNLRIAIIGGGNLGASLAEGLLKSKKYRSDYITVTRRKVERIAHLSEKGIHVHSDNVLAINQADIIILAVKPKTVDKILDELKQHVQEGQLLVSLATGIALSHIESVLGNHIPIYRAMPNTALAICESMTLVSSQNGTDKNDQAVIEFFNDLGLTLKINEELMDAATVLAACGIAFALRFIRAASQGGIEIGFDALTAQTIASQTVRGAADLLITGGQHPEREIDKVTTPKGITIAGLNEMEHQGFSSSLIKGIITSFNKIN